MRELTLAANDIAHPEWLRTTFGERRAWKDAQVKDIVDRMHNGDPTLGWPGDPRLALYHSEHGCWEVWRLEADGEYRMVMRSKPGVPLDRGLIMHLVAHDVRNGFDPYESVKSHNEGKERAARKRLSEQAEEVADRLRYGFKRDGVI